MGRMQAGLKKWAEAKTSLEIAIQTLSTGNPANPYLATSRARYGLCLLMLGDRAGAFKQANLSSSALKVQRQLSSRFAQPLNELMARLNAAP
jgi:hypothetical protein